MEILSIKFTFQGDDPEDRETTEVRHQTPGSLSREAFYDLCNQMEQALYGSVKHEG